MISAGDFRNGVTFEEDGNVLQVIEFQHVKPGKGAAFVRTKVKNVITGSVVEKSYNPTAKFPTAFVERKDMEYSYSDGDLYYFMDQESYELVPINGSELGDNFKFVKENMVCKILSYKGKVFGVEPEVYCHTDAYQFDDYSKYHAPAFDVAKKLEKYSHFDEELANVLALGARIARKIKEE